MSTTIEVTGVQPSTITVGRDLGFDPIVSALDSAATKALIVHARPLAARAQALAEHLRSLGYEAATADHPDAEAGKAIDVVAGLWDTCGRLQLGRKDAIIAMGGGATTDMAGFVAATWLRGVSLINVPTTLLGMVDAAVGGKTGINTSVGKNLVGSFYPACAVVADMSLLSTLPREDLAAGAAEVIKCGFIADPVILRIVEETDPDVLLDPSSEQLAEITTRAVAVKARVVSAALPGGACARVATTGTPSPTRSSARTTTRGATGMRSPSAAASPLDSLTPVGSSAPRMLHATTSFSPALACPRATRDTPSRS